MGSIYQIEAAIVEQKEIFCKIRKFIENEAQNFEIHEIEGHLLKQLMALGLTLLKETIARRGTGKEGQTIELSKTQEQLPFHSIKFREYFSIFGKFHIGRAFYWKTGHEGVCPLDQLLNLPDKQYSYLLSQLLEKQVAQGPYSEAMEGICGLLGLKVSKRTVEDRCKDVASKVADFYRTESHLDKEEGSILIATSDCKGVPMVPSERPDFPKKEKKGRRGKGGRKKGQCKDAVVTSDYSINPVSRTPEDIIEGLMTINSEAKQSKKSDQKKGKDRAPKNKQVSASMFGKQQAFKELADRLKQRDPTEEKKIFCLMDGERAIKTGIEKEFKARGWLDRIIALGLDIVHVSEYIWSAATALFGEKGAEREPWVRKQLLAILNSRVGRVIGALRQILTKRGSQLSKSRQAIIEKVIGYLSNHRDMMDYKSYLEAGLPIATGIAEGACKCLVKDRTDRSGMKWTKLGVQSVLNLRSIKQNGHWDQYWEYYIEQEQERLYPPLKKAA